MDKSVIGQGLCGLAPPGAALLMQLRRSQREAHNASTRLAAGTFTEADAELRVGETNCCFASDSCKAKPA